MLKNSELKDLFDRLNIPPTGRKYVEQVRQSPPKRRVKDGKSNVTVRFPSQKMGHIIQCESRTAEHVFVLGCEISPHILEIWDQGGYLTLHYKDSKGRNRGHREVFDFLTIERDEIAIVQCKKEDELEKWEARNPMRFSRDSENKWRSIAGEDAASMYGLSYRVWMPERSSVLLARNADYLLDYIDEDVPEALASRVHQIKKLVAEQNVIRLDRLIDRIDSVDAVLFAIAKFEVTFDWENDLACRPEVAFVYSSEVYLSAHKSCRSMSDNATNPAVQLSIGSSCKWDSRNWRVLNVGDATITLQSESLDIVTLKKSDIIYLIGTGKLFVEAVCSGTDELLQLIQRTSEQQLNDALIRNEKLSAWMRGNKEVAQLKDRTARDWRSRYQDAERKYGTGVFGLIFDTSSRGNRRSRLNNEQEQILKESFEEDFESHEAITYRAAYTLYLQRSVERGVESVTYPTYCSRAKKRCQVNQIERRQGKKAAYQIRHQYQNYEGKELEEPPVHGDRAWGIAHLDHTELEIELYSSITGESLGRPWLTLLIDAYCRYVLAFWLSFEKPSYRSVMMVMRRCVERFFRVPRAIMVDQGAEFHSIYTEVLFAHCKIEKRDRPASQPRFGSPVERMLGTTQSQFIHALSGNTKNRRLLRGLSKSHDPSGHACWPPDKFNDRLEEYIFDVYPRLNHSGIAETPLSRFERSQVHDGDRAFTRIPYDDVFYILTLPEVSGRTRRVRKGTITVFGLEYSGYSRPLGPFNGQSIPVKYDPYNPLYTWGYIDGKWERLICTHDILREYSERQLRMAYMEVTARLRKTSKAYREVPFLLIDFLSDVKAQEKLLLAEKEARHIPGEPDVYDDNGCDDKLIQPVEINLSRFENGE